MKYFIIFSLIFTSFISSANAFDYKNQKNIWDKDFCIEMFYKSIFEGTELVDDLSYICSEHWKDEKENVLKNF